MHPAISYESAKAQAADLRQRAQRDARAHASRRAGPTGTRLTEDGVRCEALFASGLQPSDTPGADSVTEAIKATVRRFGVGGCASRMAQEFGDHPETAAERMRWVRSLLGLTPITVSPPTVAGPLVSLAIHSDPDGAPTRIRPYVPRLAPMAIPARMLLGHAAPRELQASAVVTLAATSGLARLAGRAYSGTILRFGRRVTLREALRP